jgi:hypothetical protein
VNDFHSGRGLDLTEDDNKEAIIRNGHYEINPEKMKNVGQMKMSDEDIKRIVQMRTDYLEWVHYNFAKKVLKPPKSAKRLEDH